MGSRQLGNIFPFETFGIDSNNVPSKFIVAQEYALFVG